MKRLLWILMPLLVAIATVVVIRQFVFPEVKAWALSNLKSYSSQNLPVVIEAKNISFQFLPPLLRVHDIQITPQTEDLAFLNPIQVSSLDFRLDFLQLVGGRVSISTILLQRPQIIMDLAKIEDSDEEAPLLPIKSIFKNLELVPIREILVQDLSFKLNDSKKDFSIETAQTEASLILTSNMIDLRLKTGSIHSRYQNYVPALPIQFSTHARLEQTRILVEDFVLAAQKSQISFQGIATDIENLLRNPQAQIRSNILLSFEELGETVSRVFPKWQLPVMSGEVKSHARFQIKGGNDLSGEVNLLSEKTKIGQYNIGDVRAEAQYRNGLLVIADFTATHPAGVATLQNTELHLKDDFHFSTKLKTDKIDLRSLLAALNLTVPADAHIGATLDCTGQLKPSPTVTCQGDTELSKMALYTSSEDNATNLIRLSRASATGKVTVDTKAVSYEAHISIAKNQGTSSGVINYEDGFLIKYDTSRIDFANIENLFNLKFEGWTSVHGSTQGDSSTATANMHLSGEGLWFENYLISKMATDLEFKASKVSLNNVKGSVNNTQYQGNLVIDLEKNRLAVDASSPFLEASDLLQIFTRIVKLPFQVTGTGAAHINLEGPFAFNKLSYVLKSSLYRGSVAGEGFDKAIFDVTAKNGEVVADRVEVHKQSSRLTLTGQGHPDGNIETLIEGTNFHLEESENINKLSSGIIGLLNFRMSLNGHVLRPETTLKGTFSEMAIEDQTLPNSAFAIKIGKEAIEGSANIIGNRVQSEFVWPLSPNAPFRLKLRTLDWNFATFFGVLTGSTFKDEYQAALTSEVNLEAHRGGFWNSTGDIKVDRVYLRRGQVGVQNTSPLRINFHNGLINIENFRLAGEQSVLNVAGKNFSSRDLNLTINGRTDLRLLQIFAPFLEDLGGPVSVSLKVTGALTQPEILGSAFAEEAFVRLKGFPHAFEKVKADVLFSHTRILINSVRAQIAGGVMNADGSINIRGVRNLETRVRAKLDGISLNVPEGIHTSGSADLLFSGSWFPFVLSGTYRVTGGLFDRELGGNDTTETSVRQSSYLPRMILQNAFEPIVMDLNVNMNDGIRIKNSTVDGRAKGNLRVQGPPTNPSVIGTVNTVPPTNAIYRDKVFEVLTGNVNFNNPLEMNPELYISARSRIKEYDVNLLVQGTGKVPIFRLTSQPPLPEQDIISLLALGITNTKLDQGIQSQAQEQQTAYQLGAVVLSNTPLNREIQQRLGVEVQFTSDFDEARGIAVPKVTLSRKLSQRISAIASRSFGEQTSNEFKLNYQIDPKVSAVGSWRGREQQESGTLTETQNRSTSILGLDLEYKLEFK